jgi:hypothetical protein
LGNLPTDRGPFLLDASRPRPAHAVRREGPHAAAQGEAMATGHDTKDAQGSPVGGAHRRPAVDGPDGGTMTISLYAREGAPGIREMTETGEMVFLPIERIRTQRRGAPGHYRFYGLYRLPPEYGRGEVPVRLYENEADRSRGLNRAEHLRAIPPSDPDFRGLNARRNDAESHQPRHRGHLVLGSRPQRRPRRPRGRPARLRARHERSQLAHRHRKRKAASAAA